MLLHPSPTSSLTSFGKWKLIFLSLSIFLIIFLAACDQESGDFVAELSPEALAQYTNFCLI